MPNTDLQNWFIFIDEICHLLRECDDKLDQYGEPDKSNVRTKIHQFITHAQKQKENHK